jgi:two-component system OmpR family response regulator
MVTERRKRILIVDDEASMESVLQRHVSNAGYDFVAATSGQEALDKIEQDAPDLVLLDVVMPDMNGFVITLDSLSNSRAEQAHMPNP